MSWELCIWIFQGVYLKTLTFWKVTWKFYCSFQKNYFLENLKIYFSENLNACSFSGSRETRWKKIFIFVSFLCNEHCMKSVKIRSFFWSVFSCIQSEFRKIQTRKKSIFRHFWRSGKERVAVNWKICYEMFYIKT